MPDAMPLPLVATGRRLIKLTRRGWILARVLAEQYEAVTIGGIAARQGSFSPHSHLPWPRGPPKLLNAISVEDGAVASRSVISAT